ncbi:epithelial cell transforming 2 pebble isoform X3 [Megachile rotundata]|uniref:epithelial cell transforming 2 pebble isoform X3 n=1 Tax=Megachile rotundata TaxID=143995 RepID=UPI0006149B92|nr:PREDICTED: protein ECT2 isoform X3 [Megachile rotundata]
MEEQSVHSSISDINSEEAVRNESVIIPRKKRICLIGAAGDDPALGAAAQQFNVPVLKSKTGLEYVEDTAYCTYFILKSFEGPEYDALHKSAHRILGPTALLQLTERKDSLPSINRPMYTQAMVGTVVVFTGFRKKDELTKLINMIHNMGGSIRKEMGAKVTHLIANCCGGDKYRYAVTFRVPIMSMEWVIALWNAKDDISNYGNNEELIATYKLKPFFGAKVCFFGFPEEEKRHMCEVLQQQGGESTEIDDPNCTHVVTHIGSHQYKKSNFSASDMLPCTKNPNYTPHHYTETKPFSFTFYNPYTHTIPNEKKVGPSYTCNSRCFNFIKKQSSRHLSCNFCSLIHQYVECKENVCNHSILDDISQDSDIYIDDNLNDYLSFPDESHNTSKLSISQTDSGIDMSTTKSNFNITPTNDLTALKRTNVLIPSTLLGKYPTFTSSLDYNNKRIGNIVSDIALNEYKNINNGNIHTQSEFYNFKSSTLCKKKITRYMNNHCSGGTAHLLKFCKSTQCLHNSFFLSKKITTPRRYVKCKAKSYVNIHRITSSDKFKFKKIHSHPNLVGQYGSELNDPLLHSSHTKMKRNNFNQLNFSPALKQYDLVSHQISEIQQRQIYTPLPSPLPVLAKVAEISKSKHGSRNIFASDGKYSNVSSKHCPLKGDDLKLEKQDDKTLPLVVDESNVNALPDLASVRAHIVKAEWFWTSVQNEGAADEKEYLFEDYLESVLSPTVTARRDSQQAVTPSTASTRRKRKRLAETLSSLVQNGTDSPALHKRRSSISDAGHLSVSGSFLDCTTSPEKPLLDDIPEVEAVNTDNTRKNLSPRHQVFLELVQTESNYVGILSTIMTLFKSPLEDLIDTSGELLNGTEAKIIFGNFPPIYEVHKKMLEELRYSATYWMEDISIGNIFLKFAPDLVKAYPPYVNFFENTKEMLDQCDQNKPRFHAFLKVCQTKPECGRQSLKELLIKPVQRLPSISLLLNDILKHTNKNNPDHSALELSISSIKEVMTYINEDKRKTEGQLVMFDIFNEIDNCPPHLVSSHRSFIGKCDVMELSEGLSGRGDHLVLFLFTDTLEICKKRSKAFNSLKTPNTANGLHTTKLSQGKPYKHIKMLSLSTIKKVVDIRETDECHKVFALMVRSNQELKEKLFSFTITDEEVNKTNYLRTLCRQMANTVCKADADTFLISLDSHQLEIDTSDVALGTLSKAFKSLFHNFYLEYMDPFASRTRMKVGRAFSFNKTPSKLKRAMSTMMSPFGSTNSLTPASQQLAQMRLASCNNINELGNGGSGSPSRDDVLVAPMSVQPTRKAKCSSLSMASLRRNCSEEVMQDKSDL